MKVTVFAADIQLDAKENRELSMDEIAAGLKKVFPNLSISCVRQYGGADIELKEKLSRKQLQGRRQ